MGWAGTDKGRHLPEHPGRGGHYRLFYAPCVSNYRIGCERWFDTLKNAFHRAHWCTHYNHIGAAHCPPHVGVEAINYPELNRLVQMLPSPAAANHLTASALAAQSARKRPPDQTDPDDAKAIYHPRTSFDIALTAPDHLGNSGHATSIFLFQPNADPEMIWHAVVCQRPYNDALE